MVSSFPGVSYGPLYYRQLENEKTAALKVNGHSLDAKMELSYLAKLDTEWWIKNLCLYPVPILMAAAQVTLNCHSSLLGWGCVIDGSDTITGGRWIPSEALSHINCLELKAIKLGLQSLCSHLTNTLSNTHKKVLSDSQTAVAYIRAMGGTHSVTCNQISREILLWCKQRQIWLTSSHLPGRLNVVADRASREFTDNTEWSSEASAFKKLVDKWGQPAVDMFASRLSYKVRNYVAWKLDPSASAIAAFTLDWAIYDLIYCFPPFSLIGRVLQKIHVCQSTVIVAVPRWSTQFWYPNLLKMLLQAPVQIPVTPNTLTLPHDPVLVNPLYPKLELICCLLSGKC